MQKGGDFGTSSENISFLVKQMDLYFKRGRIVAIPSNATNIRPVQI